MRTVAGGRAILSVGLMGVLAFGNCEAKQSSTTPVRVPPPPSTPQQDLGPSAPPVVYLGGTLTDVAADHLSLHEPSGSVVRLQRLAGSATAFFEIDGDGWARLDAVAPVRAGQRACVETLLDHANLVAIRVFLGAACGPD